MNWLTNVNLSKTVVYNIFINMKYIILNKAKILNIMKKTLIIKTIVN